MAAFRVAAGLLAVPCLASPAAAELATSDLTGTWLVRGLVAGASVDNGAAFATGSVTFDVTGIVTAGSLRTALNEPFPMAPGSLVVSAEGRLTGTRSVGTDDSTGDPLFGSTVVELHLGGLNNRGEIVFRAGLLSGRQVIGVATPPGL